MAIARLSVKTGQVGKAAAHANYISRGDSSHELESDLADNDKNRLESLEQVLSPLKLPLDYNDPYHAALDRLSDADHLNHALQLQQQPSLFSSDEYTNLNPNETRSNDQTNIKNDLSYSTYGNMPAWAAHDPQRFWHAADLYERKNGSTYREYEIALPRELTETQRIALVKDFIKQEIGDKYPYQLAVHTPTALDGGEQPHAHLMFNERRLDGIPRDPEQHFKRYNPKHPERGGAKKDNTGLDHASRKDELIQLRQRWQQTANRHLEQAGHSTRIDMRSYQSQGIERQPERKYLPSEYHRTDKRQELLEHRAAQADLQRQQLPPPLIRTQLEAEQGKSRFKSQYQQHLQQNIAIAEQKQAFKARATEYQVNQPEQRPQAPEKQREREIDPPSRDRDRDRDRGFDR